MITIQAATDKAYPIIRDIAQRTWPRTFRRILSMEQIAYMLEWMYSLPSLKEQVEIKGHKFLLAREANDFLGFASFEVNYKGEPVTKIHKLYVLPATQGKGIGKLLMSRISDIAAQQGNSLLSLNVNRGNQAVRFYQSIGFQIVGEENIDIGQGFLMEDYIMQKTLTPA